MQRAKLRNHVDIVRRTFVFALCIVRLCKPLAHRPGCERILFLQLLKCGTSIGANVEEAQAGQSKADFISKIAIALKEARETHYWLRLIAEAEILERAGDLDWAMKEAHELMRILGAIASTAKKNLP